MQVKKHPKFNLENYSKIFMQLGLVLALFVVYVTMEQKTYEREFSTLTDVNMTDFSDDQPPVIVIPEPEIPKPKPVILDHIKEVDDSQDIEEVTLPDSEGDETLEILDINDIVEVDDPTPEPEEDVPFINIENAPIFPGCKGDNEALKTCFNKKIQKHFIKKFDADLPNELGLSPGKKRLIMLFKIDKTGKVIDVRVKAPHPRLQKEAVRIIKLLPEMIPGKQRGKAVGVKYTLPMRVDVE